MAIYRFRVSFEDYDDVVREIDIKSTQTFEDLHYAIHKGTGYNPEQSSSFYVSNDHWIKGDEIAFLPTQRKQDRGVTLMAGTKLNRFIDDPHQKFYYTYNFDRPFDFHVELLKILLDEDPSKVYPAIVKSVGEPPKPAGSILPPPGSGEEPDDLDFLADLDDDAEPEEEMAVVDELGIGMQEEEQEEEEEEKDEFMDEFSDNDNFESDDYNNKEDY
ncbi:hypothetical protein [Pedobacter sp. SYSU D00535]|uniref:IS1096 element passenger TnpR family protein n=1 Tax=Pedobacter sp. SYSU D00535 TaxID=2810308 RepID=UPI001A964142|nr:hypothetical protein [Pedobacter sp. SYSU D00535]